MQKIPRFFREAIAGRQSPSGVRPDPCPGGLFPLIARVALGALFLLSAFSRPPCAADGFYIRDAVLMDAKGYPFEMRGISVPFAWYDGDSYNALPAIAGLGANTVRIVWHLDMPASRLDQIIRRSIDLNMIAVPELHNATGKDDAASLLACANYWARPDIKAVLDKYRKQAIVNIANEWMGSWGKTAAWIDAYKNALSIMRKAGIANTILVDAGGWGQDYTYILNGAPEVMASDSLENVMFAVHMYGQYGTAAKVQAAIGGITGKGIPMIVGEFGWKHSDGEVDEAAILSECRARRIGYLAWSWKGNGGGVEYLDLSTSWTSANSLSDWGETIFNSADGIGPTAKRCTLFTDVPQAAPVRQSLFPPLRKSAGSRPIRIFSLSGRLLPAPGEGEWIRTGKGLGTIFQD